jgi:hypothetical protein
MSLAFADTAPRQLGFVNLEKPIAGQDTATHQAHAAVDTRPRVLGDLILVDVVRLPLHVRIERAPAGYYTALDTKTGIFGRADNYDGALSDLLVAIDEFRDVLASEARLTPQLADYLRLLNAYLRGLN